MALGRCMTTALEGVIAHVVTVEANVGAGLPGVHVVGLADTAISESRDRIRTAVVNSRLPWAKTRVVVSMSPAALPKSGAHFDLPMALAILAAQMPPSERLERALVLGELGLDGSVRPVSGIIPALLAARSQGFETLVIPPGNAAEATLVPDMDVVVAATLTDAFAWACGGRDLPSARAVDAPAHTLGDAPDYCDIAGQREAKWAAEVAAAGGHHLMLVGPPGSGKSMIAARLPSILPALSADQCVEATAIHSLAGTPGAVIMRAPFIAPHSSVTRAALLGGGSGNPRPGAVSLAHHGVLFLDEASEVSARVLDGLRAPLEEGHVRISRARREITFPARFQLVLAANPCRCAAEDASKCTCRSSDRRNYLSNLSGPLRDRLDMVVNVSGQAATLSAEGEEDSATIAQRVAQARQRAATRWREDELPVFNNGAVPASYLRRHRPATETAMAMLAAYLADGELSQRGVDRVLRLAWTLADLDASPQPDIDHVGRALELRGVGVLERLAA
ncbi:YifB family Mg chelatase-like AAA ATPase [Corynebacterium striatum]|uniref:YifB family Mg chelatase-like AAA ATPase n=1 Tax=Corynebacterium striatum TaxID=43770 RepID=UPI001A2CA352|nr:YifB family Mg chelatase-like AAA ATPase [Corynebacterium striatum]MDC7105083.1 YifB family Mg chelatase-like AAA ATPase [Corynebacterium striatum]HAT1211453.1 YifB family Mg chelatase-like AAA ATPase [Corynebacterium striatum]HAT1474973.1 YifB family Mg chelatase-like AAA ATPase [Corynebacterium striatum]HAT6524538.1 YifB family Mg chelatase-like AAA ATPase [Corynebacterium striatum]HAT6562670.1 YifB family Mg chelatase-like AAA ATPase [Corynebacterium striatum]